MQIFFLERVFAMRFCGQFFFLLAALIFPARAAERINHAGRILGPMPVVTNAILFNTPEADAVMAGLQVFPRDNAWNEDISRRPLLANSDGMIAQIFSELNAVGTNSPKLRAFKEMNFIFVPNNQPLLPIQFVTYPGESDPSPYPIATNLPIEGWPSETGAQTLTQVQCDTFGNGGDRHSILIQPGTGYIWETWETLLQTSPTNHWQAANGARFNITNNTLRPAGWTSADAAGLSMLGGLVRYDECERGEIEHALRMIVKHTRREYIYPATHYASSPSTTNANIPAMGQRLRLKAGFTAPANWTKEEKAIVAALKKYGGLIADNSSSFFSISVVPDQRWPSGAFDHITGLSVTNFEVIQTTGPTEGPRSPGAPVTDAGPDQTVPRGTPVNLAGVVHYTNAAPLTLLWKLYSGPGNVTFGNTSQTNTTATFTNTGQFILMLSADDGIHTPAYDAVSITVTDVIQLNIQRNSGNAILRWIGGTPPFELLSSPALPAIYWTPSGLFTTNIATLSMTATQMFFRVRGQ
ncbi:MAG TPA: hypothetical protein VFT34_08670 [Verrucomicrobiae bacterium]|nr:hypothetical protein [Verrucomicrobiae bacterium]